MDSDLDARTTGRVSSASGYRPEGATDAVGTTIGTPSTSTSPRLDTQSRNNLRQASVALDTAYERITSLRNSINNMLNRIPAAEVTGTGTSTSTSSTNARDAQPRTSLSHDASIRPPHSALVLSTGEEVVEELNLRAARLRSLISPSARQRLEQFESSRNHTRRDALDRFSQNDLPRLNRTDTTRPAPPRPRSPPMPDLILPNAARGPHSVHRDDSSTMIGRRVAARVNAADGQNSLSSRLTLSQIEQRLQAQTVQVSRELENMTQHLAATTSRRVELASSRTRGDHAATAAQEHQAVALSNASGDVRNPTVAGGPLRPARDVTLIDNTTRIFLPQPISRTSSDGTPLNELSARRSLSAAFRDHTIMYQDHVQAGNTSQDSPRNLANAPEVRGTLVNVLTRNREEQYLPTRQSEHARLGVEIRRRDDVPVRSDPSSPAGGGQVRRRRGWSEHFSHLFHTVPSPCLTAMPRSSTQCGWRRDRFG